MDRVCPLLGLAGDRRVAVDGVDGGHRCYAEEPPSSLDRGMQAQLCLTTAHERCERFMQFISRTGAATPGRSSVADGFVSTRLLIAPEPAWRGMAGRARSSRSAGIVAAAAGIAVLGVAGATVANAVLSGPPGVAATATPETTPSPTLRPTATPSPTPSPTPVPTPTPTPVPATPVPTPVATAVPPPPQQTYVVEQGDTLAAIAQRFGTTAQALQAANGIEDPDEIFIGQVLVIP